MRTTTLCGILVGLTLTPWPVQAHDIYGNLVGTHGEFCCHGTDCRPAPWRSVNGGVEMYVNGRWISVHDEAIQARRKATMARPTAGTGAAFHWVLIYS